MRARAEDRIRTLKDTGLANLPLQEFAKNEIWLELAVLAYELMTWTQLLDWPDHPARSWEPQRLRLRLLSVAARIIATGRRRILHLNRRWPWSELLISDQRNIVSLNQIHRSHLRPRTTGQPATQRQQTPHAQISARKKIDPIHSDQSPHETSRLGGAVPPHEESDGLDQSEYGID
jgi:hypothetical protein